MQIFRSFYVIALLFFFTNTVVHAADNRDLIIQKQMDCADDHLQEGTAIGWNDICEITPASNPDHLQIVNQQLDQVQGIASPQTVTQPTPVLPKNTPVALTPPEKPKWTLELSPQISSIRYHEPAFMKETGDMYGINTVITYHPPVGDSLNSEITDVYRLEAMFSYGKVNYHGGIQNGDGTTTPESFDGINDYMFEVRDLAGKDYYFNNQLTQLTPYFGAGYRSLYDAMYANKPFGYNRRIQYLYLPIGADITRKLSNGWSVGANAEYDLFIRGFATSYLETIGLGKLTNTQKNGYGVRGSIRLIKNFDHYNFIIEPYVRFWHIQNSREDTSSPFSFEGQEYVISGIEPNNNSIEIGGKFGIEF